MRIAVLGTGYVGLSTVVCLSEIGHHVMCIDINKGEDGTVDLTYLKNAAIDISIYLKKNTIVVIKSTVPVGTNVSIINMLEIYCGFRVKLVSIPEFLRQGSAIQDAMFADRIIQAKRGSEHLKNLNLFCPFS